MLYCYVFTGCSCASRLALMLIWKKWSENRGAAAPFASRFSEWPLYSQIRFTNNGTIRKSDWDSFMERKRRWEGMKMEIIFVYVRTLHRFQEQRILLCYFIANLIDEWCVQSSVVLSNQFANCFSEWLFYSQINLTNSCTIRKSDWRIPWKLRRRRTIRKSLFQMTLSFANQFSE